MSGYTSLGTHLWLALSSNSNLLVSLSAFQPPTKHLVDSLTGTIGASLSTRGVGRRVRCLPGTVQDFDHLGSGEQVDGGHGGYDETSEARRWQESYVYHDFEHLLAHIFLTHDDLARNGAHIHSPIRKDDDLDVIGSPEALYGHGQEDVDHQRIGIRQVPDVLILPFMEHYAPSVQLHVKNLIQDKRFELDGETYLLPEHFCVIGLANSFCQKNLRHDLIDRFGLSLCLTPDDLRPSSAPLPPLPPSNPVPRLYSAPPIRTYISDLMSATRHHALLHNTLITSRCSAVHVLNLASLAVQMRNCFDYPAGKDSLLDEKSESRRSTLASPSSSSSVSGGTQPSGQREIRPDDVREIFASCILHRLRVREESKRLSSFWNHKRPDPVSGHASDPPWKTGAGGNPSANRESSQPDGHGQAVKSLTSYQEEHIIEQVLGDLLASV